jgi:hypothetical protein
MFEENMEAEENHFLIESCQDQTIQENPNFLIEHKQVCEAHR